MTSVADFVEAARGAPQPAHSFRFNVQCWEVLRTIREHHQRANEGETVYSDAEAVMVGAIDAGLRAPSVTIREDGEAIVLAWPLPQGAAVLTLTGGEVGIVVRRDRKTVVYADSIPLGGFLQELAATKAAA